MAGMPGMPPGGGAPGPDAPPGAGLMASPQAGLPPAPAGDPRTTMMLGQLAANLLKKQQGTKYAKQLIQHIRTILQKVQASNMFENPQAESDMAHVISKLAGLSEKLDKTGPSNSPALSSTLSDIVGRAGQSGAAGGGPMGT